MKTKIQNGKGFVQGVWTELLPPVITIPTCLSMFDTCMKHNIN